MAALAVCVKEQGSGGGEGGGDVGGSKGGDGGAAETRQSKPRAHECAGE